MPKFRKKPVVVEARRLTYDNADEIIEWVDDAYHELTDDGYECVAINTLEGTHLALFGDWIIRGVEGEFYPCKPSIFDATYEPLHPAGSESLSAVQET